MCKSCNYPDEIASLLDALPNARAASPKPAQTGAPMGPPARPIRARPDGLGRIQHRIYRTHLMPPGEPIVDVLDQGLVTKGVFTGKNGWVLTPRFLYGLATGRLHKRHVVDRRAITSISVVHRARPAGVVAASACFAVALIALGAFEGMALLSSAFLVVPVLVMVFGAAAGAAILHAYGRQEVVEVVANGQRLGVPIPGIADDDVLEFANQILRPKGPARAPKAPAGPTPVGNPARPAGVTAKPNGSASQPSKAPTLMPVRA